MADLPPDRLHVLVVDDEAPARQRLTDLLRQDPLVASVREAGDGRSAIRIIQADAPDLVFLDVRMPELNGLEVVAAVGAGRMPLTVFVTAYDQHAIRAFEANALDYLLKPFSDERLEATMLRARLRLDEGRMRAFARSALRMMSEPPAAARYLDRLVVKAAGTTRFVPVAEIDRIEAAGVYVTLHGAGRELMYRAALSDLADNLDPRHFIRIHRSVIVNIDSIVRLEAISHGEFELVLRDGARCRVSRTFRAVLEKRLGQSL